MKNILRVESLTKRFGGLVAVNDLSFEVEARSIHSLIGPNGSGKTTTINMINGTFPPTGGRIYFGETDITGMQTHKICTLGIARTFQNIKLFSTMTVEENLKVGGHSRLAPHGVVSYLLNPVEARKEENKLQVASEEIIAMLRLEDIAKSVVASLPYGKLKIVELARALMSRPQLLLLDEPAAGLNPSERAEFIDVLLKVFESEIDLFLIEHNMDVVMNISDKITVINFGSKIAEGDSASIQNDPEVIKAYLGEKYIMI